VKRLFYLLLITAFTGTAFGNVSRHTKAAPATSVNELDTPTIAPAMPMIL
jgi:hypothetical protein